MSATAIAEPRPAQYCPVCWAHGVMAVMGGPTCRHTFPGWDAMWARLEGDGLSAEDSEACVSAQAEADFEP